MKMRKELSELAQFVVDYSRKLGADGAEAFISDNETVQISVSDRQVEQASRVAEAGIGLRLLKDQKMVFGSSNDLSQSSIKDFISDLMRKVPFHTPDEFYIIPGEEGGVLSGDWSSHAELLSYDPKIAEVSVQEKIKRAVSIETSGLDFSPKVLGSMFVIYQDMTVSYYLANSNGIAGWYPGSACGGGANFSAGEGEDRQSGTYIKVCVRYEDFNPEDVGRKGAQNAVRMLGARPIQSCEVPLIVSPEVGTQILSYIAGMLSADMVQKGKSLFAGKLETKVASDVFNLVDDGKLKGGLATSPVDGEGVPRQTTPLIVDGILRNYLYNSYTAKKGRVKSTGNHSRDSFQSRGGIGSTNLYLRQSNIKPESLISTIGKGFYLKDAFGLHAGINSISGDFSIPVAGFMIEKGKVTYPVRGITIGGNLFDLLKSVNKVADDLTWFQSVACPTFLVSNIKIGGASR